MIRKLLSAVSGLAAGLAGCVGVPDGLEPVSGFELQRYLGKWYEIARLDHSFERDLSNVSATYTRGRRGEIRVRNRGFNPKTGVWKQIEGQARFLENETVGSLKVSFFGPFYGGYHIIALDRKDYRYAMVAGPNRSYLWILSRDKTLDAAVYEKLVSLAKGWGFDIAKLIRVEHDRPEDAGGVEAGGNAGALTPCPVRPNCVSSIDADRKRFIAPLHFTGSLKDAQQRLLRVLSALKRMRVVTVNGSYIHVEAVSAVFGFVDDLEFFINAHEKVIHVRSAARTGYWDLGVNRRRMEEIRRLFKANTGHSLPPPKAA